ncbi:stalk domain-containing protein [Paenibacillus piri]|uniref:Copper amine oxidase-like N-terminal domain-containing protein n=1 Tax=Paenibacillus piri TaxID=2547395 RepID=A0A4R5KQV9_9BACL|nr:stalk domain-containing protein [Paenibacillus piri]TDF97140.1 hypothetical protein E1757_14995 [Paenibacillus piri]
MNVAKGVGRFLALLLLLNQLFVVPVSAAPGDKGKELPQQEAVRLGVKSSQDLRDAKAEVTKKKAELVQAQYAVKSAEAKDAGLFAKPRNLSQDLQLRMKIPEARKQLLIAEETVRSKTISVQFEMEKLYWSAVQSMLAEAAARKQLDGAMRSLDGIRTMQKLGLADQAAREQADKAVEQAASELKKSQLAYKSVRLALGEKTGLDLEMGVTLSYEQDYANLNQAMLEKYTSRAEQTNLGLLQDREERRLADEKFNVNRKLYSAKFGDARMRVIESMYQMKDMDYDLFMASYDETLEKIREDWEGWVWLGIIPVPKSLIQGEYDGLRYFDDLRQSLPISMMDRNKAILKEKESRQNVILEIRQSYLDAKGAEEAYAQSLRARDKAVDEAAAASNKIKLGLLKQDELQKLNEVREKAEQAVTASWLGYKLALGKLNVDSGGEVERTYKKGVLPYREIDDGLAKIKPPQPEKKGPSLKWELKPSVGDLLSDFSVQADKKLGATDYALFTAEGKPIGRKKPIHKPLRHLSVMFSQPDSLNIALFKKNEIVAEGALSGYGTSGTATLDKSGGLAAMPAVKEAAAAQASSAPQNGAGGTLIIGTYRIPLEALTPELYNTAKATMTASGQGVFYKSELSGGAWISADSVLDLKALEDANGPAAAASDKIAALKLTVEINPAGTISPLLTAAQLTQEIEALTKEAERLKQAKEEAEAANKAADIARLSVEWEDAKAQLALMQALQSGDQQAALKQIALVHNPDALVRQLEAEAAAGSAGGAGGSTSGGAAGGSTSGGAAGGSTSGGAPGAAGGSASGGAPGAAGGSANGGAAGAAGGSASGGAAGGSASGSVSAAVYEQRQQELQAKLQQALAAGDAAAAAAQAGPLAEAALRLAQQQSGAADSVAALQQAKGKLQAALAEAQQREDAERVAQLQNSIAALDDTVLTVQKQELFMQLDALQLLPAQLLGDAASDGASLPEGVSGAIADKSRQLLEQLKQKELEKYTPEQQAQLAEAASEIKQAYGAAAQIIPVEQVLSPDLPIRFEAPPVLIGGNAFLPIRPVSEAFGAAVIWDEAARTVTVSHEGGTVVCTIDSPAAYADGEEVTLDALPALIAGRTYVPLRFIAETIGLQVEWNETAKTILISSH